MLFNESIKDNILYGKKDATDQKISEVCELANAIGFIEQNADNLCNELI